MLSSTIQLGAPDDCLVCLFCCTPPPPDRSLKPTVLSFYRRASFIYEYNEIVCCLSPWLLTWLVSAVAGELRRPGARYVCVCVVSLALALKWHTEGINRAGPQITVPDRMWHLLCWECKVFESLLNSSPFLFPPPVGLSSVFPLCSHICVNPLPASLPLFTIDIFLFPPPTVPFSSPPVPFSHPSSVSFFLPPPFLPPTSHTLPHICCHVLSAVEQPRFQFRV